MENKTEQINIRVTPSEKLEIEKRAAQRKQRIPDFMRDVLLYGLLPARR